MNMLGVDVGGTFTDAVLLADGELRIAKVPTARRQEESVLAAARAVGAGDVERFTHGTTVTTGRRRRLKSTRPARPWVEPEQLPSLLDSASGVGRVLLGILAGAGLRIGEALALRWAHVDLATGTLYVVSSKTDAGVRSIDLTAALREELVLWRAESAFTEPDDFVLPTSTGRTHSASNFRRDVLRPAIEEANGKLARDGIAPIEAGLGFHGLRRTFASLRCALGDDVAYTSSQLGHEDPRFTLRCYAQATKRRERLSGPHRKAYDRALEWAQMGTSSVETVETLPIEATKNPV